MPRKHRPTTQAPTTEPIRARTLRERDAAQYINLSPSFLKSARLGRCDGPPFVRLGRAVRYLVDDLDAWLERRRVSA